MKHTIAKTSKAIAAAGAAAFILTGCSIITGETGGSSNNGSGEGSEDPVYAEMASWNACEVLDNLQPITDYMGIQGYGSSTAQGGEPGNSEIGNTFDPDAIGCNGLFSLGEYEGYGMDGEIKVKIVPTENQDQALTTYEERVSAAESESASGADAASEEFTDPWNEGVLISWTGSADQPNVELVALGDQWVFHIQLYYTNDWGLRGGGDPALPFAYEELNQWFVETYAPQVNQIVNDRLAEVQ
jgi:hypothetical protein